MKVTQSCLSLCDPLDYTVHGICQARILEWVAFPFSRESSQPRIGTQVSHIAGWFFTSWATGKPKNTAGGWVSLSLLQGIFPTPELNLGLPHCGLIFYQLSYQESPGNSSKLLHSSVSGSVRGREQHQLPKTVLRVKWVDDYKVVWTTTLSPPLLQVAAVSLGAISPFNQELLDILNSLLHTFPPWYSGSYTNMINAYLEMSWVYTHLIISQVFPFQEGRLLVSERSCSEYVWSSRWWTE